MTAVMQAKMPASPEQRSGERTAAVRPLVIVPTYNERENLPALVAELLRIDGLAILVVDDGSPDGTGAEADRLAARHPERVEVMHRRGARGLGRSYIDGMRQALDAGATHVCQMDADFSHDPADVPRLLAAAAGADLVIGSRYVAGGSGDHVGHVLRIVGQVGVHLEDELGVGGQRGTHPVEIRPAEAALAGAMQHRQPPAAGGGDLVGQRAGAVGRAVVDHHHAQIGIAEQLLGDERQVLPLVVGREQDQDLRQAGQTPVSHVTPAAR